MVNTGTQHLFVKTLDESSREAKNTQQQPKMLERDNDKDSPMRYIQQHYDNDSSNFSNALLPKPE